MTDIAKNIKSLVSEKLQNRNSRMTEASNDLEEQGNILTDYRLYFSGVLDALKAVGATDAEARAVRLASDANETEMNLLEQRIHLQRELEA